MELERELAEKQEGGVEVFCALAENTTLGEHPQCFGENNTLGPAPPSNLSLVGRNLKQHGTNLLLVDRGLDHPGSKRAGGDAGGGVGGVSRPLRPSARTPPSVSTLGVLARTAPSVP